MAPSRVKVPAYDEKAGVKLGVLFLQLGGPERTEDVEGFLYNLFADPGIDRNMCTCIFKKKKHVYAVIYFM